MVNKLLIRFGFIRGRGAALANPNHGMAVERASRFGRITLFAAALLVAALLAGPATAKYGAIVINADTGEVLHEAHADARHYPASLTKMMTLYLVFEAVRDKRLSMNTRITVSQRAANQPPSRLGFQPGETITVRDAIGALIVRSANDVAAAVAEHIGGTERRFGEMMTARAAALGMTETSFRNASGLPNRQQLTTARDLARLVAALQRDFPEHYKLFAMRDFTWRGQTFETHNRLLARYQGTDGVKTGYIRASGFNLATSASRDGVRLIAVVMGTSSPQVRDIHMMGLLERGFENATQGRYIAYDYDRNVEVATSATAPAPAAAPRREKGATGTMALSRLTPPRRPIELAGDSAEGSSPTSELPATAERPALDWEIQVGAFSQLAPAHLEASRAQRRLPSLLAQTTVSVTPVRDGRTTVYRARLAGLDNESAARACELLKARSLPCMAIPPEEVKAVAATP